MKQTISIIAATSLLLTGCASPYSQQVLANLQQQCAAGNPNACYAAAQQAQFNQQEAAQNAGNTVTGLAILGLIGAVVGVAASGGGYQPHYHHHYRHW